MRQSVRCSLLVLAVLLLITVISGPLMNAQSPGTASSQTTASSTPPTVAEAEELMRRARVRRLPVINSDGSLVGVISLADLAREAARQQELPDKEISSSEVHATLAHICAPAVPASALAAPAS